MLAFRLETLEEAKVILAFHVVGTVMELFKTSAGSWLYPEPSLLRIGGVPLFSGFMYAAVGSYIARVWRIFRFRFAPYPRALWTQLLAVAAYVNFFAHHWLPDVRLVLFAAMALLFWRTRVYFTVCARSAGCRCCSAGSWSPCSSGSPRTSAPSPAPGPIPRSSTAGRWSRPRSSARGTC